MGTSYVLTASTHTLITDARKERKNEFTPLARNDTVGEEFYMKLRGGVDICRKHQAGQDNMEEKYFKVVETTGKRLTP